MRENTSIDRKLLGCRDDHGRLALHWAAASGHADLVALLLGAAKAQKAAVEAAPEEADPALLGLVGKPVHDIQVVLGIPDFGRDSLRLRSADYHASWDIAALFAGWRCTKAISSSASLMRRTSRGTQHCTWLPDVWTPTA